MARVSPIRSTPRAGRYALALGLAWTFCMAALALWDFRQDRRGTEALALNEAQAHYNKDRAFRLWATSHGRIYVPLTEQTQPSQYMAHMPEQVIETPTGQRLTLINPARIVRQLDEGFGHLYGVSGRVTSLQPLSPENAPDAWERVALERLRNGAAEVREFTERGGEPYLRLMRPMVAEEGCLLCHGHQGFEVGQVSGGVSVSVPMKGHLAREWEQRLEEGAIFALVWLLGLTGIGFGGRRLELYERSHIEAMQRLRQNEAHKRAILDSALDCIITIDGDDRIVEFNPAAERVFGYRREQILSRSLADTLIPIHLRAMHLEGMRRCLAEGGMRVMGQRIETTALRADGNEFPVELAITHVERGERPLFTAYLRDISKRVAAERALRASEERYALAARGSNDGLWDWELAGDAVYYSERWQGMLGLRVGEHSDSPEHWLARVHPQDRQQLEADLDAHLAGASAQFTNEHRIWHEDGVYRWVLARGIAVRDEAGQPYRLAGSLSDITERRLAEEQLRYDAFHDALTGLSNRALFLDHLEVAVRRLQRAGGYQFAVLFLDLDRFKLVNDGLGHLSGDELLVAVGQRLAECVRPGDTVARLGGDEFAVLAEDLADVTEAERLAERIIETVSRPVSAGARTVATSCSVGIAWGSAEGGYGRGEELLRDADTAMYQAKLRGKARHEVFEPGMHLRALGQLELENDLRGALERGELRLQYQPVVSLKDGSVQGFEALLRWLHPQRGMVSPLEFIPAAEESGLILPIGRWVLEQACMQLSVWQTAFDRRLCMSINVSPKQFAEHSLPGAVAAVLERHGLSPESVKLELTESTLLDSEGVSTQLDALRALGVGLCIDDFGTGYSAMSYLHRFPVTVLKIDRAFVNRMANGGRDTVATIIALADGLGLETIAEGVETGIQADLLRSMGCALAQGYYYSRPLPRDEAESLLQTRRCGCG